MNHASNDCRLIVRNKTIWSFCYLALKPVFDIANDNGLDTRTEFIVHQPFEHEIRNRDA
ncbi:hypothetical protein D3C87_1230270 [compost metagenome]